MKPIAASRYRAAMPAARSHDSDRRQRRHRWRPGGGGGPGGLVDRRPFAGAMPSAPSGAWRLGAVTLLVAGLPFRLSQQYWRFAGMGDSADRRGECRSGRRAVLAGPLGRRALGPHRARASRWRMGWRCWLCSARRGSRTGGSGRVASEPGGRGGRHVGAGGRANRGLRPVPARPGPRPASAASGWKGC
jgi:hypothetical protein